MFDFSSMFIDLNHFYGVNWADLSTFAAAYAALFKHLRKKSSSLNRVKSSKVFHRKHSFAAATTAIAKKAGILPNIFSTLDQVMFIGALQNL